MSDRRDGPRSTTPPAAAPATPAAAAPSPLFPLFDPNGPPTPAMNAAAAAAASRTARVTRTMLFAGGVLSVAVLYWLRDLLVPFALSLLIAFVLEPLVSRLQRWRLPNAVAVTLVTVSASAVVVLLIWLFVHQTLDLAKELPKYRTNLIAKLEAFRTTTNQPFKELHETLEDVQKHIVATQPASTMPTTAPADGLAGLTEPGTGSPAAPMAVQVVDKPLDPMTLATTMLTPIIVPLTTAGMVFVLVFFLLLERDLAVVRFRYLTRRLRMGISEDAMDDATQRLGRYLRMQLIVNLCYGTMVALAMWSVGLPNAALWGMAAALLRYVPYVGPVLAATMPILLSIAFFNGWGKPLTVTAMFLVAETVTNGILEPLLYGTSTGVSSLGVVLASFFWGWLWGPIGLILAMPMTVCLVVLGRQVPSLVPISFMLSGDSKMRHKFAEATAADESPSARAGEAAVAQQRADVPAPTRAV